MRLSIFSDFDDTVSIGDIGNKLFTKFGEFEKYFKEFSLGRINIRELNIRLCESIPSAISLETLSNFANEQEIDLYFLTFIKFCNKNNYSFRIVSDGYDIYIQEILKKYVIDFLPILPVHCNKLVKTNIGFKPIFYDANESCNCTTASCKRNVVLNNSSDEDIIVYIGDGITDFCVAEHSDIVFAKSALANYCRENKIPYYPFRSFFDIQRILQTVTKNKKLKKRNQAFLKRKSAFEAE